MRSLRPNDQTEFPAPLVAAVNEAWRGTDCGCFNGDAVCLTHQSLWVLRMLRDRGWLKEPGS